jgi:hypothetical protein
VNGGNISYATIGELLMDVEESGKTHTPRIRRSATYLGNASTAGRLTREFLQRQPRSGRNLTGTAGSSTNFANPILCGFGSPQGSHGRFLKHRARTAGIDCTQILLRAGIVGNRNASATPRRPAGTAYTTRTVASALSIAIYLQRDGSVPRGLCFKGMFTSGWHRSAGAPNESPKPPIISIDFHRAAADYKRLLVANTAALTAQ